MARDPRETVAALRRMTVANGCTPDEADNARRMADALCEKHGIAKDHAPRPGPGQRTNTGRGFSFEEAFGVNAEDVAEAIRQAMRAAMAEAARRENMARHRPKWAEAAERARREREARFQQRTKFATVRECAEYYLDPRWKSKQTGKALSNKEVAALCRRFMGSETSPASVAWCRAQMKKEGRT